MDNNVNNNDDARSGESSNVPSAQQSRSNRTNASEFDSKSSRVRFVAVADPSATEVNAPLLGDGDDSSTDKRGLSHTNSGETMEADLYGNGDDDGLAKGRSSKTSSVVNRQRSRTLIAQQRDIEMQAAELEKGFFSRYANAFRLMPFIILQGMSSIMLQPILPGVMINYFGDEKKAASVVSYAATAAAILGMFTAAIYGRLLDTIGRKWFFVIAPLFQMAIPQLLLVLFRSNPLIYIITGAVGSMMQDSYISSYIADNFSSKTRVSVFAAIQAVGNLTAFTALLAANLSDKLCEILACCFAFGTVLYAAIFIKESIPDDVRQSISVSACCHNPFSAMIFLLKSKVCRVVIAMVFCFLFAQVGTGDIYMYFLAARVGFNKADNAYLFVEDGITTPIVMLLVLPFLSRRLSPTMIIFVSLTALFIELILIATIWAKWPIYAFVVPCVSLTMMMVPILQTVLVNAGNPADQGRRLTGFSAVADLCNAIGPLVFGSIYGNVTGTLVVLPFVIAAALCVPNGFLAFKLPDFIQSENEEREAQALALAASGKRSRSGSIVINPVE